MSENIQIGGYKVVHKLGSGGYGEIFSVQKPGSSGFFALKTETLDSSQRSLATELRFLKLLPPDPCFPRVISDGHTSTVNYFVMPLYGPSVGAIRRAIQGQTFSLPTVCRLAYETIQVIEKLHNVGIVHCDVKPDNFLLNQISVGGFVLIDFGLSAFWRESGGHIPNRTTEGFKGTLRYGSIHVHKMSEPSRRDDVISWFYSLIEMGKGKLPWKDVQDGHLAMSCKQTITPEKLCGGLPAQMQTIWNSIKDLEFEQQPNYVLIKTEIEHIFEDNGWGMDCQYDWELNPQVIYQLTPFPELFERNLMEAQARAESPKKGKKGGCFVQSRCKLSNF
jgi:serine/threonine protein kinase